MSENIKNEYSNGEVTILWEPAKCIHSAICVHGLPSVFNPQARPWVNIQGESSESILEQVRKCPSGALSIKTTSPESITKETIVEFAENGPMMVYGNLTINERDGSVIKKNKVNAFCRCGASENKPYCDGSHKKIGFTG